MNKRCYLVFLFLTSYWASVLTNYVDTIFEDRFFPKKLSTRENIQEFFQFSPSFIGWTEVFECSVDHFLLRYQVGSCYSGISVDSLLQRASKGNRIWLQLNVDGEDPEAVQNRKNALQYFFTRYNGHNLLFGLRVLVGPNGSGALIDPQSILPTDSKCNVVFMFAESSGKEAGYTPYQLNEMHSAVAKEKPFRFTISCALDIQQLAHTNEGLAALKDLEIILFQRDPRFKPDLMQLKIRFHRILELTDRVSPYLDGAMHARLYSQFPFVDWDMKAAPNQLYFPDHYISPNAFFTDNHRIMLINGIPCGDAKDYSLASSCSVVPEPSSDYLMQVADKTMTLIFSFSESKVALRSIPFHEYRYPPFVLLQAVVGPNAPEVPVVVDVNDSIHPHANVRYVFGFAERSLIPSNAYEEHHIDSLISVLRTDAVHRLPAFGIQLHVSLMAHESVAQLLRRLENMPKFQWLILYQRFYQKESPNYDLNEDQLRGLKKSIRALGWRDTFLLVDEKLTQQIFTDETIPGLMMPEVQGSLNLETPSLTMHTTPKKTTSSTVYPPFTVYLTTKRPDDDSGTDLLRSSRLILILLLVFRMVAQ